MTINGPIIDSAWEAHRDVVGCNFRGVQNMCLWDLSPVFGQVCEYGRRIYTPLDANSGEPEILLGLAGRKPGTVEVILWTCRVVPCRGAP